VSESISSRILKGWNDLRGQLAMRLAGRRRVRGVQVLITNPAGEWPDALLLEKITAALDLIATHQPQRLRRIQRDVARIWIRPQLGYRASFIRAERSCVLDVFFVATFQPGQIAASVVHEGMHARITAAGLKLPPAREERACRRAELRFGRAIADQAVIDRAASALALSDQDVAPLG
jgi:hypothetical protein